MISGHGNIETAVSAIKIGAYDFIEKPFKADRLILVVERALETSRLRREVSELRSKAGRRIEADRRLLGDGNLRRLIERVGPANSRVLISGPAGSGKELTARMIHAHSTRTDGPFVVVNAPAITPEGMEANCSASRPAPTAPRRVGALEEAHGGTLYLDEVADMPAETQAKILRVLVDQSFRRVGGDIPVQVDVRIISSTSRDLAQAITDGPFPRGSVPPALGGADPLALARRAARGHPGADRLLPGARQRRHGRPPGRSRRMRWRCCNRTTGPATSGSCATTSSG